MNWEELSILSVFCSAIKEQQKYEMRKQTSVDNKVNNLHHDLYQV